MAHLHQNLDRRNIKGRGAARAFAPAYISSKTRSEVLATLARVPGFRKDLARNVQTAPAEERPQRAQEIIEGGAVREVLVGAARAGDEALLSQIATDWASAGDSFAYVAFGLGSSKPHSALLQPILRRELEGGASIASVLAFAKDAGIDLPAEVLLREAEARLDHGEVEDALVGFRASATALPYDRLVQIGDMMMRYGKEAEARMAFAAVGARERLISLGDKCAARNVAEAIRCYAAANAVGHLDALAKSRELIGDLLGAEDAREMARDIQNPATR